MTTISYKHTTVKRNYAQDIIDLMISKWYLTVVPQRTATLIGRAFQITKCSG